MKKILRNISYLLLALLMLPALSGCDTEDDLIEIFTGKTWKMSRLANKDSNRQFYSGLWQNEKAEEKSREALKVEGNFTLIFEGSEVDGELLGTRVNGGGIKSSISGIWNADGKSHSLSLDLKVSGSAESDPLAKAFINGLQNVYKYEGDASSLTLYFKDGDITRVIGFKPQ